MPSLDLADIQAVVSAIRSLATTSNNNNQDAHQNNKFLVLVNPQAGTKIATKIYETIVKPMLQQAGIHHDVYLTESNRDAEQYMRTKTNLLDYTAYICMGGDGVLHETIQGIKAREDADLVRKKLALGVVGCGTGNGLAKSILHASEVCMYVLYGLYVLLDPRYLDACPHTFVTLSYFLRKNTRSSSRSLSFARERRCQWTCRRTKLPTRRMRRF